MLLQYLSLQAMLTRIQSLGGDKCFVVGNYWRGKEHLNSRKKYKYKINFRNGSINLQSDLKEWQRVLEYAKCETMYAWTDICARAGGRRGLSKVWAGDSVADERGACTSRKASPSIRISERGCEGTAKTSLVLCRRSPEKGGPHEVVKSSLERCHQFIP
ncbi:hypothetical protein CVT26_012535 [Gymnopilus dilepis]|uniref:Uncharacterized protein n=1 Tax=Gymnopilus dilepis TaxID=231916 RepID=A0A409WAK3_9AGAR|nr:hypothetical protein CVT26_012535 [Gymnopilus dilepis]